MSNLGNLESVVERKSGQKPISFDAETLRSRLGYDIGSMQQNGFDPSIIEEHQAFNDKLEASLIHPDVSKYLSNLTTENIYTASGVRVLTIDAIKEEIQQLAPSSFLFQYGYLPIASSIGGNVVCLHVPTNRVVWADHDSFGGEEISFQNRVTKEWEYIPFSPDNIEKALVPLAADLKTFLSDLLDDKLQKQLDELD
jgi:hypothetical protein